MITFLIGMGFLNLVHIVVAWISMFLSSSDLLKKEGLLDEERNKIDLLLVSIIVFSVLVIFGYVIGYIINFILG